MRNRLIAAWLQWEKKRKALGWRAYRWANRLDTLMFIAGFIDPQGLVEFELFVFAKTGDVLQIH